MPVSDFLDRRGLASLLLVGPATVDRYRAAGRIGPKPVNIGGLRWSIAEVKAWLEHRMPSGELADASEWPAIWARLRGQSTTAN